jgi:hypothetical protein
MYTGTCIQQQQQQQQQQRTRVRRPTYCSEGSDTRKVSSRLAILPLHTSTHSSSEETPVVTQGDTPS